MSKPTPYQQFEQHIKNAKKILITAHRYPDIDAIGSCLALADAIKSDKTIKVWIPKNNTKDWDCFPKSDLVERIPQ